jgi:hypothetical protein
MMVHQLVQLVHHRVSADCLKSQETYVKLQFLVIKALWTICRKLVNQLVWEL